MDFGDFDTNFSKLRTVLKNRTDANKSHYEIEVYGSYVSCYGDIEIIVGRIEGETRKMTSFSKEIINIVQKNEKPSNELLLETVKNFTCVQLDIKSFYIFTRIFLDTLARIVRLFYGRKGEQLPFNMTDLLKSKKAMELDCDFFKGLNDKMSWYDGFTKGRDDIIHYLGSISSTSTRDGFEGFDILSVKEHRSWGTDTVKSIIHYVEEILSNLSEVILYIHDDKPQSS